MKIEVTVDGEQSTVPVQFKDNILWWAFTAGADGTVTFGQLLHDDGSPVYEPNEWTSLLTFEF